MAKVRGRGRAYAVTEWNRAVRWVKRNPPGQPDPLEMERAVAAAWGQALSLLREGRLGETRHAACVLAALAAAAGLAQKSGKPVFHASWRQWASAAGFGGVQTLYNVLKDLTDQHGLLVLEERAGYEHRGAVGSRWRLTPPATTVWPAVPIPPPGHPAFSRAGVGRMGWLNYAVALSHPGPITAFALSHELGQVVRPAPRPPPPVTVSLLTATRSHRLLGTSSLYPPRS